jgi:aspartyl/asparaginyl-tRNA synthetase
MLEPEMAFADLPAAMDNAENMLKYVVKHVLDTCDEDLTFFSKFYDEKLKDRLDKLVNQPFTRCAYRDAITYLQEEIAKDPSKWQFPEVEFGTDLATEHERWLAEVKFDSCVFIYNYPKSIKAFYMRDNDEDGGETVNAMDLLVPGVGELIGGSQRVRSRLYCIIASHVRCPCYQFSHILIYTVGGTTGCFGEEAQGFGFEPRRLLVVLGSATIWIGSSRWLRSWI